jgi:hypothetical protein
MRARFRTSFIGDSQGGELDQNTNNRAYRQQPGHPEQRAGQPGDAAVRQQPWTANRADETGNARRENLPPAQSRAQFSEQGHDDRGGPFGALTVAEIVARIRKQWLANPEADPVAAAISQFDAEAGHAEGLVVHHNNTGFATDAKGERARIRALQTIFNNTDWTRHGR